MDHHLAKKDRAKFIGSELKASREIPGKERGIKGASFRLGLKVKLGEFLLCGYKYGAVFPTGRKSSNTETRSKTLFCCPHCRIPCEYSASPVTANGPLHLMPLVGNRSVLGRNRYGWDAAYRHPRRQTPDPSVEEKLERPVKLWVRAPSGERSRLMLITLA